MRKVMTDFIVDFKEQLESIKTKGMKSQIPNMLTFSRALAPLVIIPTILFEKIYLSIILLIIFAITDFLDGRLARKYGMVSDFGIKLDAVCDKIFALSIMFLGVTQQPILMVNLILELAISYVNLMSAAKNNEPKTTIVGKIKTVFLSVTLVLICFARNLPTLLFWVSGLTALFQLMTLIKYIIIDKLKDKKKESKLMENES